MDIRRLIALARSAMQIRDGFSIGLAGRTPVRTPNCFMVSLEGHERRFEREPSTDVLVDYIVANLEHLSLPGRYLGGWLDSGVWYLDVSVAVFGLESALALAKDQAQRAVYDLWNCTDIRMDDAILASESSAPVAKDTGRPSKAQIRRPSDQFHGDSRLVCPDLIAPCRVAG